MNITDRAVKSVAFIGIKTRDGFSPRATCFFVVRDEQQFQFRYLVTAEHVVSALGEKSQEIWLRVNTATGGTAEIKLDYRGFYFHPDAERIPTDVAIYPVETIKLPDDIPQLDVTFMALDGPDGFLPSESFKQQYMGRGADISATGLFRSHYGKNKNIPIIRTGHIAATPDEPVKTRNGFMKAYLVEMQSIAGLSGSPVFAHPDMALELSKALTRHQMPTPPKATGTALIGLIQGHFDVPNLNQDVVQDSDKPENSVHTGIGVVVPVEKIVETIDQKDIRDMRKKTIDEALKSSNS